MKHYLYAARSSKEEGQALAEYALMAVYIGVALIVVLGALVAVITAQLTDVTQCLHSSGSRALTSTTCDVAENPGSNIPPTASFIIQSCSGLTCTFNGGASSDSDGTITNYGWTFGSDGTGTGTTTSHTFSAAGTYTISLAVTDDDGATDQTSQNVVLTGAGASNQAPTASFTFSCTLLSCNFNGSASSDPDGTISTYLWQSNGSNIGAGVSRSYTFASSGSYTIKLIVTDNGGAQGSSSQTVTVNSGGNVAPVANFTSSCTNLACTFTNTSTDSDGTVTASTWDYTNDGTADATSTNGSFTFSAAGTYDVKLTVTDNSGTNATVIKSVTVTAAAGNVAPVANFTSSCTLLVCSFTNTSTDDVGIASSAWDYENNGSTDATTTNGSKTYSAAGTYTVKLTVTDAGGLTHSVTKTVTVSNNAAPVASFTSSCTGLTCTFTNTSTDDVGIDSSAWDYENNGSTDASTTNGGKTYASAGTYSVKLTVTDAGGLSHFITSSVTVTAVANVAPVANFDFSCASKVCSFTSTSTDSDGTIASYSWDLGDGNSSTQQNPNHTYGTGSSKTVTLTVTDNSGATHSVSKSVGMNATNVSPVAGFNISCTGLTCTFTNTSSDSDGSISSSAWDYDNNGSTDATIAGAGNGSKTYSAAGTYTIKLTVTDNSASTGFITKSVTVTVPNVAPVASFTTSCSLLVCTFTNTSTDSDGSVASSAWDYDNNGSTDATVANAGNGSKTYSSAGTYTIKLTVTDNAGGTHSTTRTVTVVATNTAPVASFTSSCTVFSCTFTNTSTDSDGSVSSSAWDFNNDGTTDQTVANAGNGSFTYPGAGTYTAKLTVTDNGGATHFITNTVTVSAANTPPTANFTISCSGLSCTFTNTSTDAGGSIASSAWDYDNNGTTDATVANAGNGSFTYSGGGSYNVKLTVTDNGGATASTTLPVNIVGTTMSITSVVETANVSGSNWVASIQFTVRDNLGSLVSGVTVTGNFSDAAGTPNNCITVTGTCTVTSNSVKKSGGGSFPTLVYTVTGITGGSLTYSQAGNTDPQGDISNGGNTISIDNNQ